MTTKLALTIAGLGLALAVSPALADTVTVICDGEHVITFTEEDGKMLQEELGVEFEDAVCEVGKDLNWATYETPTKVTVTMSTGREYEILAQTRK